MATDMGADREGHGSDVGDKHKRENTDVVAGVHGVALLISLLGPTLPILRRPSSRLSPHMCWMYRYRGEPLLLA